MSHLLATKNWSTIYMPNTHVNSNDQHNNSLKSLEMVIREQPDSVEQLFKNKLKDLNRTSGSL